LESINISFEKLVVGADSGKDDFIISATIDGQKSFQVELTESLPEGLGKEFLEALRRAASQGKEAS